VFISTPAAVEAIVKAAELVREVPVAAPISGVVNDGEVENTRFVFVVPVVPVAELR